MRNIYITKDEVLIWGKDDNSLINNLQKTSWDFDIPKKSFMKNISRRCKITNGAKIRFDSEEIFIKDLLSEGFLIKIETH
jgi:hypothetical protein